MPLETATFIDGLNTANPTAGDPKSEGDDHIRLIKSAIKATFPNINAAVTATPAALNTIGARTVFSGSVATSTGAIVISITNPAPIIVISIAGQATTNGASIRAEFSVNGGSTYTAGPVQLGGTSTPHDILTLVFSADGGTRRLIATGANLSQMSVSGLSSGSGAFNAIRLTPSTGVFGASTDAIKVYTIG